MNRRRIHLRLAVTPVACCALLLTACCGSTDDSDGSGTPEPSENRISDLVIDTLNGLDSFDPLYRDTPETEQIYRLTHSAILRWKEDNTLVHDKTWTKESVGSGSLSARLRASRGAGQADQVGRLLRGAA